MEIKLDDLTGPEIRELLEDHLRDMREITPPESVHALDLGKLRSPDITFWTVWSKGDLVGCGALRELDPKHGEIKSMRTARAHRRRGVARAVLGHIIDVAKQRGYSLLSLETGAMKPFEPAHRLYESFGFVYGPPFGEYVLDPNSVYMSKEL